MRGRRFGEEEQGWADWWVGPMRRTSELTTGTRRAWLGRLMRSVGAWRGAAGWAARAGEWALLAGRRAGQGSRPSVGEKKLCWAAGEAEGRFFFLLFFFLLVFLFEFKYSFESNIQIYLMSLNECNST
jgi:hypothetical protein